MSRLPNVSLMLSVRMARTRDVAVLCGTPAQSILCEMANVSSENCFGRHFA